MTSWDGHSGPEHTGRPSHRGRDSTIEATASALPRFRSRGRRLTVAGLLVLCALAAVTMALGYANKARCTGPEFNEWGRSEPAYQERSYRDVCYSDIQNLWIGRDIDRHVFPYVHGGIDEDGSLHGGVVEYPVLSGLLIWAGAIFVDTDAGYLAASALLLAPFGLLTAWWLGRLRGWRALLWALGPPLVLYSFHNWDLPVVACAVGAVFVMHRWKVPLRRRATLAAVLLGAGFAFKIYPGLFVLPLVLYVLTGGRGGAELPASKRFDVPGALRVLGASVGTVVAANLPFALAGFEGWLASFQFQSDRQVDLSTNSVWYWAFRDHAGEESFQQAMSTLSPTLVLGACALACWVGWRVRERWGTFPWIQVSAAMLCAFLLLHKVHSPQYTLWLLPFFVLVSVRWGWVVAYFVADLAMGISIFRWMYLNMSGAGADITDGFTAQALMIGVWGRAALLVGLFVAFLSSRAEVEETPPAGRRPAREADEPAGAG